eukprot:scaffold398_cov305-Prasinococcus_capsulatus_cf.AAC.11
MADQPRAGLHLSTDRTATHPRGTSRRAAAPGSALRQGVGCDELRPSLSQRVGRAGPSVAHPVKPSAYIWAGPAGLT